MKDIKRRIKSVGSTMQITKAMELVASSKLRNAKKKTAKSRPFFEAQMRTLIEIARSRHIETKFTEKRKVAPEDKKSFCIVIAGDRGLAGGYNSGMFKMFTAETAGQKPPIVTAIGKKSVEYFEKRGFEIATKHPGLAENMKSGHCAAIANTAIKLFLDGEVDEVKLFYTKFISSMVQEPAVMRLLPVSMNHEHIGGAMRGEEEHDESTEKRPKEITFDPSPEVVFNQVVPGFLMSIIECAVNESYTSEQCARRIAMESASDNAEEMIDSLSLLYNRARQEKITNEINEIVGGANAL
jgi:F-type H+-transporting ATPase subunit gamma